jgi:hypothetical protein
MFESQPLFNGYIRYLKFWDDVALSQDDVSYLYFNRTNPFNYFNRIFFKSNNETWLNLYEIECWIGGINVAAESNGGQAVYTLNTDISDTVDSAYSTNYPASMGINGINSSTSDFLHGHMSNYNSYLITLPDSYRINDIERLIVYNRDSGTTVIKRYYNIDYIQFLNPDGLVIHQIDHTDTDSTTYEEISYINYIGSSDNTSSNYEIYESSNIDYYLGSGVPVDAEAPGPDHEYLMFEAYTPGNRTYEVADSGSSTQSSTMVIYNKPSLDDEGMTFNGEDQYGITESWYFGGTDSMSFECVLKWADLNSWSRVFDFADGSGLNNYILANSGTTTTIYFGLRGFYDSSTTNYLKVSDQIEVGEWMHIAGSIDISGTGSMKLYVNGEVVGTIDSYSSSQSYTSRIYHYIGRSNWDHDGYFSGTIKYLRFWDTYGLSDSDVETLYETAVETYKI